MNCQDISLALDDRDIGALNAAQRIEFDAHVAACPDCAQDWELHQRMMAVATPEMPAALLPQVRGLVAARSALGSVRRGPNRLVLLGTVLVVAAAAAMLVMQLARAPAAQVVAAAPAPVPAMETPAAAAGTEPPVPATVGMPAAVVEQVVPKEVVAEVRPFTARLMPLKNEATSVAARTAIDSMYAALVERLRAVPGLTLLGPDPADRAEVTPGYRITIQNSALPDGKFGGGLRVELLKPDGALNGNFFSGVTGDVVANCTSSLPISADVSACMDAEGVAINLVGILRKKVFPPDPSLRRQLQARLIDRSLESQQRLSAFYDLSQFGFAQNMRSETTRNAALRDPALVHGAIDLATTAADPVLRAQVWNTLRDSGNPELIRALLTALRQDADGEVRLAAIGALVDNFSADPNVRAALESTAGEDAQPLVRALARRAVGGVDGYEAWKDFITTSLRDTSSAPRDRVAPLFFQLGRPVSTAGTGRAQASDPQSVRSVLQQLDPESIQALVALLPALSAESTTLQMSVLTLAGEMAGIDHPAVTDMLLASANGSSQFPSRLTAIQGLGAVPARRGDPRVRAVLEKAMADEADPQVRQAASFAFQRGAPAPAANTDKARLGVSLRLVKPGDFGPPGLVGKVIVATMGAETVAQRAGIREGDVLVSINGTPVTTPAESVRIMDPLPRGVDIDVMVEREGKALGLKARF